MSPPLIEARHVTRILPGTVPVTLVRDVSLTIGAREFIAITGPSGSGKSTLFKSIMGFVAPRAGEVRIAGLQAVEAQKRNLVAYVPQSEDIDWNFPVLVEEAVMMGRYGRMGFLRIPSAEDRRKVDEALERVGMTQFRNRQIGELSGGQKKRVFLARALAQEGLVILLDEPFTGVDVKTEAAIVDLLQELKARGHLMLVSTHNLGSVPDFCDQVVLVQRRVLAAGPTQSTFTQANLERAFGGVLRHFRLDQSTVQPHDGRTVTVLTDDERPLVFYGDKPRRRKETETAPK